MTCGICAQAAVRQIAFYVKIPQIAALHCRIACIHLAKNARTIVTNSPTVARGLLI